MRLRACLASHVGTVPRTCWPRGVVETPVGFACTRGFRASGWYRTSGGRMKWLEEFSQNAPCAVDVPAPDNIKNIKGMSSLPGTPSALAGSRVRNRGAGPTPRVRSWAKCVGKLVSHGVSTALVRARHAGLPRRYSMRRGALAVLLRHVGACPKSDHPEVSNQAEASSAENRALKSRRPMRDRRRELRRLRGSERRCRR